MKLGLNTGIQCPNCRKEIQIETGFWGGLLFASVIERIKNEGVTLTCSHCKVRSRIEPE
ncbi:MAG: hypothetical protein GY861_25065 [bacterium]|nr:hypothetical protein [bacterium]